jgi:peptide deformylase
MTELPKIAQLGDPILRHQAQPVSQITDQHISKLIDSLIAAAISNQGVGIAAPQISESYRLFIIASHECDRYPDAPTMKPTAMINPQILYHSEETVKDWEGCLSIPGIRGLVSRYREIEVEYITRDGEKKQKVFTDFIARIFQHELDHLDGIVFIDRIETTKDLYTEQEYRRLINQP